MKEIIEIKATVHLDEDESDYARLLTPEQAAEILDEHKAELQRHLSDETNGEVTFEQVDVHLKED